MSWEWPATYDRDGAVQLARVRGERIAERRHLNEWDAADFVQEAMTAALAAWPQLTRDYALPSGRVEGGLIAVAIDCDLVDYTRRLLGRGRHRRKPHFGAGALVNDEGEDLPLPDPRVDVETQALDRVADERLDETIEKLVARGRWSERTRAALALILRRMADGWTETAVANELGYSVSYVSSLLTRFRRSIGVPGKGSDDGPTIVDRRDVLACQVDQVVERAPVFPFPVLTDEQFEIDLAVIAPRPRDVDDGEQQRDPQLLRVAEHRHHGRG